jgi:hypothetical protein
MQLNWPESCKINHSVYKTFITQIFVSNEYFPVMISSTNNFGRHRNKTDLQLLEKKPEKHSGQGGFLYALDWNVAND